MLVLTRYAGERIMIGENIVLTVQEISHNRVRIGIDAPKDVMIYREEVLEKLRIASGIMNPKEVAKPTEGSNQSDAKDK